MAANDPICQARITDLWSGKTLFTPVDFYLIPFWVVKDDLQFPGRQRSSQCLDLDRDIEGPSTKNFKILTVWLLYWMSANSDVLSSRHLIESSESFTFTFFNGIK